MSSKPKIYTPILRKRCLQPTAELMEEVGGIVKCPNGLNYAYRAAGNKILAVAHCDSVTCDTDHFFAKNGVVWCTRLDDRLGVFTILDILPDMGISVDILLTDGEESCNSTARYVEIPKECDYNWIVQFDRRGTDVVTYQFGEMDPYAEEFFGKAGYGSYSDICELDWLGCAAMNVGIGYHEEHSLGSHAKYWEYRRQLRKFYAFYQKYYDTKIEHTFSSYGSKSKRNKSYSSTSYSSYPSYPSHYPSAVKNDSDAYDEHDNYYRHPIDRDAPFSGAWDQRITTAASLTSSKGTKDVECVDWQGGFEDWPSWTITFKDGKVVPDVYAPDKETAIDWAREYRRNTDDENWLECWQEYVDPDSDQRMIQREQDEILSRNLPTIIDEWPDDNMAETTVSLR